MKNFMVFALMLRACFVVVSAHAQALPEEATFCKKDEEVYFSCPLSNGKQVSICAKNNDSPSNGYVRYEYGDKTNSFVYPSRIMPSKNSFTISDVSEGSIRGLHLHFTNGAFTYVVSSVWPGQLYVSKRGQIIFDQQCQASRYKSFSDKVFNGIKQVQPSEVDVH